MNRLRLVLISSSVLAVCIPIAYFLTKYNDKPTALSPKQTVVEYRKEESSLMLAPGWKWPGYPVRSHGPNGQDIVYQEGWGKQAADLYWFCSWTGRAVNPKLSETERQQALKKLPLIQTKYFYTTSLVPVSKPPFNQMLRSAEDGNLKSLRGFYEANCSNGN